MKQSTIHGIFISYAHIDNQPLVEGAKGWVDKFHSERTARPMAETTEQGGELFE